MSPELILSTFVIYTLVIFTIAFFTSRKANSQSFFIGNNKSPKSIGLIYYLLAKGYCKAKGIEKDIPDMEWWIESDE